MGHSSRRPAINLISSSSPATPLSTDPSPTHQQSQSPFRYVRFQKDLTADHVEKAGSAQDTPLSDFPSHQKRPPPRSSSLSRAQPAQPPSFTRHIPASPQSLHPQPNPPQFRRQPSQFLRQPAPLLTPAHLPTQRYTRPRGLRIANCLRPWLPLILYGITSLAFVFAIALWRDEVFARLDELSHWLRVDPEFGYAVLFLLIFITTIPPIPLYSTLIVLSGYTFGAWTGAVISYLAALTGALVVFVVSRSLLRDSISRWLASTVAIKRSVRAIEKRPKLLFLIRLAPYPYNVMNCLLAASPTLTLKTYTVCTALSLFKVIIHTGLGASIHSFKDYHVTPDKGKDGGSGGPTPPPEEETGANKVARLWTIIGVILCVLIFVYISVIANRAVDEELGDDDSEEREAFLGAMDEESHSHPASRPVSPMLESPFRTQNVVPFRVGSN